MVYFKGWIISNRQSVGWIVAITLIGYINSSLLALLAFFVFLFSRFHYNFYHIFSEMHDVWFRRWQESLSRISGSTGRFGYWVYNRYGEIQWKHNHLIVKINTNLSISIYTSRSSTGKSVRHQLCNCFVPKCCSSKKIKCLTSVDVIQKLICISSVIKKHCMFHMTRLELKWIWHETWCLPGYQLVSCLDSLTEFLHSLFQTRKAMDVGRPGRISVEDIIFLIRKDPKKFSRVRELLTMNEELRKARKAFDDTKYASKWRFLMALWLNAACASLVFKYSQTLLALINDSPLRNIDFLW